MIDFSFDRHRFSVTPDGSPAALDLLSMLPLALTIEDYGTNEKIAFLPRKLNVPDAPRFGAEAIGDFCYFAPWGNIVFFHGAYRWSTGLVRLGRISGGIAPLLTRGKYPLTATLSA